MKSDPEVSMKVSLGVNTGIPPRVPTGISPEVPKGISPEASTRLPLEVPTEVNAVFFPGVPMRFPRGERNSRSSYGISCRSS